MSANQPAETHRGTVIVEVHGPVNVREPGQTRWIPFVGSPRDPWHETGDYPFGAEALATATEIAASAGLEVREGAPSVEIQRGGETEWNSVKAGDLVAEGDALRTGAESWALIDTVDNRAAPEEQAESVPRRAQGFASRVAAFFKPKTVVVAVVVGVASLFIQLYTMGRSPDEQAKIPILGPAIGWANTVPGSIFWAIFPFIAFAAIGYSVSRARRRVGPGHSGAEPT